LKNVSRIKEVVCLSFIKATPGISLIEIVQICLSGPALGKSNRWGMERDIVHVLQYMRESTVIVWNVEDMIFLQEYTGLGLRKMRLYYSGEPSHTVLGQLRLEKCNDASLG
jgi:hypothetical protein